MAIFLANKNLLHLHSYVANSGNNQIYTEIM